MTQAKVTIVGAGHVGATAAFRLLLDGVADVVLVDVAEGIAKGKALDMMHARSVERFRPTVVGSGDYGLAEGSDVVVVTAGLARKPGMSRDDLLESNARIVRSVVNQAVELAPEAVLLVVTNPLDVMTYLAYKESGHPPNRVLGMGGVLDSARFAYAICDVAGAGPEEVEAVVMGAHGDKMVPVPSLSKVGGRPIRDIFDEETVQRLLDRTVNGGAEVVALLETGSAYYAPGVSVAKMVRAILEDSREPLPSCVYLDGEYGISDVYMSVPAVLGREGVVEVPEMPLDPREAEALRDSARTVADALDSMGFRG
ncbi:MAG: malate dehydrogenase [Coriobacteriia bacterium]